MADPNWVFVERFQGRMRRVTLLDDNFEVITVHDRGIASAEIASDEVQLLRAIELEDAVQKSA
jgi:hypothetical protein